MFEKLFTFEGVQEACSECFGFSDITMLKDFGPLIKGNHYPSIWFQFTDAKVQVFEEDGTTIRFEFEFELTTTK